MRIELKKPPEFNFQECLWFLDRNYDECLHHIQQEALYKLLNFSGKQAFIKITETTTSLLVEVLYNEAVGLDTIENFVVDWFYLDTDLSYFYESAYKVAEFYPLVESFRGLRLMGIPNVYEALLWCVIGQQINLTFACKLKRRFIEATGNSYEWNGKILYAFPSPDKIRSLTENDLKQMQFSQQKINYIIHLSEQVAIGKLSKTLLQALPDTKSMIDFLCTFKGIGEWTANYVLMKSLRRHDCIPWGDAGLLKAFQLVFKLSERPKRNELQEFFNKIEGYQSYGVIYLWRVLTPKALT